MRNLHIAATLFAVLVTGVAAAGPLDGVGDPMRPPMVKAPELEADAPPPPPASLTAIWSVGNRRFAVVNDEVVEVGKVLGDKKVTRIEDEEVLLRDATGETIVLSLVPEIARKLLVHQPPVASTAAATASVKKTRITSEKKR
jgi:hypothetical protein